MQHIIANNGQCPTHIGENRVHLCNYCGHRFYKGFKFHLSICLETMMKEKPAKEIVELIKSFQLKRIMEN